MRHNSHTLLRLTAANANIGAGVMQLVGGAPNGDGTQQVFFPFVPFH